jgi:AcrR family transcriptional regulator
MPVKGKTKQEVVSEFRCAEILEAARKVFSKNGFIGTTVDDIAGAAGVAKGTVYLYFRSKREIYLAALTQGIARLNEETRQRVAAPDSIQAKIRAFVGTRVRYFEENREFFKIYHSEFGNILVHPAQLHKDFKELYCQQAKMLEGILREAAKQGTIRCARADSTALIIYEMTRGLIVQRLLGWSRADVEGDIEFLFDLIWRGIANP